MVATAPLPLPIQMELTEQSLTIEQLVVQIQALNPTASASFLSRFSPCALGVYLSHLCVASEPRGRDAPAWVRPADTRAVMAFEAPDDL